MYQHILLATDLSDKSYSLEDKSAALQKLTGAKLTIIHVVEALPSIAIAGEVGMPIDYYETEESLVDRAKIEMEPILKRLNIPESNMIIGTGRVSYEILRYAEEKEIDLIICGSHGRHGLQLLLGSTANAILHGTKCDVLSVRFKDQ